MQTHQSTLGLFLQTFEMDAPARQYDRIEKLLRPRQLNQLSIAQRLKDCRPNFTKSS